METAMVVEQRKQHKKALKDVLREEGLRVESFESPEEAASQVERVAPDLVIMDFIMPSRSGLRVLEQLKSLDMPVILITGKEETALEHDLYSLGDVVEAPIADRDFKARIRGILKRRSRKEQAQRQSQFRSHRIAAHVLPELHDPSSGRLDARRIAEYLGVALSALAKVSGMTVAGLHKTPASSSLQEILSPIARSLTILSQLLGSKDSVRTWMNSPHPDLGGRTPISVMLEGKARAVSDMLEAALAGQPS